MPFQIRYNSLNSRQHLSFLTIFNIYNLTRVKSLRADWSGMNCLLPTTASQTGGSGEELELL